MTLFHITTTAAWDAARAAGTYVAPSLATEGFIHLSTAGQWPGTQLRYYKDRTDLLLLELDPAKLSDVRFEPVRDDRYPHQYGPIPLDAVVSVRPLPPVS